MVTNQPEKLRVVVFKEGDRWSAQCLEHDIAAFADDVETLIRRMTAAINAECDYTRQTHGTPFHGIDAAPERFVTMFERVDVGLCLPEGQAPTDFDFRLAA